ncbi:neprilysin-1 [Rhipicephalus sanguineus]|uniref:neprilysin-1 n=1 Tax=Rhipicephalus sanguineus TaxID=34632 RepID=UPI001895D24A|nr:neprilysin-1 [Rhipicephalus sanguineus]
MRARSLVELAFTLFWICSVSSKAAEVLEQEGTYNARAYNVCATPACIQRAQIIKDSMNKSVDPCTDFYAYACGGWMARHKIPESQSTTSSFSLLDDELRETLRDILGNMTITEERQNVTDKAAVVYNACVAVPDLEDRPDVMFAIMNASGLAQWPITGHRKDKNSSDRTAADVLKQTGIATLFSLEVSRDFRKLISYAIQLDQPDFSMVGRNEIINQTTDYSKPIIDVYRNVIVAAMEFMKPSLTDGELHVLADTLLAFEGKLANLTAPPEERRDVLAIYRRTTINELESNFTNIPIGNLLQKKFDLANITLAQNETVELFALEYYRKLNTFLGTADADTLFNYAGLRRMLKWAATVSHHFRKASFQLRAVKQGVQVEKPRWQRCVDAVNDDMPEVVGKLYVQSKFSPEAKHEVQDLARRLMIVFYESLQTFKWMDETTRDAAETKLAQMATKIGYPDWLFNETYIEELYKFVPELSVNASYGEMMYALSENHWKQEMLKLRKPYNKDTEWPVSPAVVNAFYSPSGNEMVFPSGILQGVFYGQGLPRSINFGAIGTVVGHEMTHGFDDTGSQFDANGALKQWWTNDTRAKFMDKAKCFEDEYGNITDVETNMTLNGKNTVGENIADNGGLRLAFEAYKKLLQAEYKNVDTRLKDLEEFSGEQLFFIANAMVMCSLSRPEYLKEQIQYDPHSPSQYGVNVPLSNLPAFSDTFKCPPYSTMNRRYRCAIW